MKKAIYKVPNGKLLKVFVEENEGRIVAIKITGDFFAHPEENIEKLEQRLVGTSLDADTLDAQIQKFFESNPTSLFGLDTASLVSTILNAS